MTGEEVSNLYNDLERLGITIWIDGGWGVDALLGKQTRPHRDLDIAIQEKDVPEFRELMESRGYKDIRLKDAKLWNFVLGDSIGHEVDAHVIELDEKGNGIYGPHQNGDMYPADALTGKGEINGQSVRCISPEWMVKFHSKYELKEKDFLDVSALCEKFGMKLPKEYQRFKNKVR